MKSLNVLVLLTAVAALSACEKAPQPELQSRPPATEGMPAPHPAPGSQVPVPEPSPANPNPRP